MIGCLLKFGVGLNFLILLMIQVRLNSEENKEEIVFSKVTKEMIFRFDFDGDGFLNNEERLIAKKTIDQEKLKIQLKTLDHKKKEIVQKLNSSTSKQVSSIPGIISPKSPNFDSKAATSAFDTKRYIKKKNEKKEYPKIEAGKSNQKFKILEKRWDSFLEKKKLQSSQKIWRDQVPNFSKSSKEDPFNIHKKIDFSNKWKSESKLKPYENAALKLIGDSLDRYKKYDKDGDGKLSKEEKNAFLLEEK